MMPSKNTQKRNNTTVTETVKAGLVSVPTPKLCSITDSVARPIVATLLTPPIVSLSSTLDKAHGQ